MSRSLVTTAFSEAALTWPSRKRPVLSRTL